MKKMSNMSRRRFLQLSAGTGVGLVAAACAPQAAEEPAAEEAAPAAEDPTQAPIALEVADWQGGQLNYDTAYDRIIAVFEENNPGVTVSRRAMGVDEYRNAVQPILASGDLPDIMGLYQGPDCFAGIEADLVINLAPILKADKEWGDRLAKSMAGFDDFHKDGDAYAIPLDAITIVSIYHQDLIDAAGLSIDKFVNINDYQAIGLAMVNEGKYFSNYGDTIASITVAVAQQTGDNSLKIVRQAERGEVSWTEDVFLNAWKSWNVLMNVDEGLVPPDIASGIEFEQGFYDQRWWGHWYWGEWAAGELLRNMPDNADQVGITNFPQRPNSKGANIWSGGPGQILSVANQDQQEWALKFAKHLSSAESAMIMIEESIHPPVDVPNYKDSNDNPIFHKLVDQFSAADALVGFSVLNADIANRAIEHGGNLMLGAITPEEIGEDLDTVSGYSA